MFKYIIARTPCSALVNGLSSANEGKPDHALAMKQHLAYLDALRKCDVEILLLPPLEDYADSVFVEDPALCTKHCAIVTRPGAPSRRAEIDAIEPALRRFYSEDKIEHIKAPGTVEAGDIMMIGDVFYIGLSARTNLDGAQQMLSILEKYGLSGHLITLEKVLHLKTGLAYLENNNLLACGEFLTKKEFSHLNIIEVPESESYATNCIWVNNNVIMPSGYPITEAKIRALGYNVFCVDTSEYRKVDGGVSCLSLRF